MTRPHLDNEHQSYRLRATGQAPTCGAALWVIAHMAGPELERLADAIEAARVKGTNGRSVQKVSVAVLMDAALPHVQDKDPDP